MSDSYQLGWPPGPHPDASGPEAAPCARCGHRADSPFAPGFLLGPGPLVAARHCRCSGYTRPDSATPLTPGPARPLASSWWPEGPGDQF
jgi:hypothetical protein